MEKMITISEKEYDYLKAELELYQEMIDELCEEFDEEITKMMERDDQWQEAIRHTKTK